MIEHHVKFIVPITPTDFNVFRRSKESRQLMTATLKEAWALATRHFHDHMRDKRFSQAHGTKAGYAPRKQGYLSRKFKKFGHTRPLEFSGQTRRAVAHMVRITSTSKGGRAAYAGARVFNFRNKNSDPSMNLNLEFRRILPEEAKQLAGVIDEHVGQKVYERMLAIAGWME